MSIENALSSAQGGGARGVLPHNEWPNGTGRQPINSVSRGRTVKQASMKPAGQDRMAFLLEAHAKGFPLNIRVQDVAAMTGLSVSRLNVLRLIGGGPRFLRFGRTVRYKLGEVIRWMDQPDYASTTEADRGIAMMT